MALATLLGGFGDAYRGYTQGARQAKADDMQDQVDALETKKIAAATDLLPGQTATAKLAQQNQQAKLQAENELIPGATQLAKADQQRALDAEAYKTVAAVMNNEATVQQGQQALSGMIGKAIEQNDNASLTRLIGHSIDAPMLFPGLNGLGKPVNASVIDTPAGGVQGANGQPIVGRAIKVDLEDGTSKYLRADIPMQAWLQQKAAAEAAGSKVLKVGETWVGQSGNVLGRGAPQPNTALEVERFRQANGAASYGGNGTPGSAGTVGKGKAAATPEAAAQSMLDDTFEKNGKDLPADARVNAKSYVSAIARANPTMDAATISRVAFEAATNPAATAPALDPATGLFSKAYRNPEVNGGKPIVIATGAGSAETMEKALGGKDAMKKTIGQMMQAQDPTAQQLIFDYAAGGDKAAAVEARLAGLPEAQRAQVLQSLQRKAALVKQYGVAPAASPAASPAAAPAGAPAPAGRGGLGGLLSGGYTPPADSQAGRALAARQQSATRAAADKTAKEAARTEALRTASSQFQNEVAAATTPEARLAVVRKWDAQRSSLPQSDLITLNQLASKI